MDTKGYSITGGNYIDDNDFECIHCGAYDPECDMCTIQSEDRWYACLLYKKEIKEYEYELKHASINVDAIDNGALRYGRFEDI